MDQKTSILINRQVPEYVREEYPLFLTFLEAYYEFLESKQGSQKNDLTTQLKSLRDISDVDESIEEFETQFLNSFASLIPVDAQIDKSFLLKNILPLYQAKGSENSFKLIFRMLFGEETDVFYPRDNILRASDGNWKIDATIKVSTDDISSFYIGTGTTKEFNLLTKESSENIQVYVGGVLQTTGFKVFKEYQLLSFDVPVANNSIVEVFYTSVDKNIFTNRKLTGKNSDATVLVEKVFSTIVNNESVFDLYIDTNSLIGEFEIGEQIETDLFVNDVLVNARLRSVSKLNEIIIIDSGSNYNVGDPVIIIAPGAARQPKAIISSVSTSTFQSVDILLGGAGFEVGSNVTTEGFFAPIFDIKVNSVLLNSSNSANSLQIFSDVISDIDPSNTTIGDLDYGLSGPLSGNANTVIAQSFSNTSFINIGEIIGLQINSVQAIFSTVPVLDVEPAKLTISNVGSTLTNTTISIKSYGSIGKTAIRSGGQDYVVGDELIFTNKPGFFGVGAEAEVREVDANGSITLVKLVPPKIAGTVNVFTSNVTVIGTSTQFETELIVGDKILINDENKIVLEILSNTTINVDSTFETSSNDEKIRLYGKNLVGGGNYKQEGLPTITVNSLLGTSANIEVVAIMGEGEDLQPVLGNVKPGGIETITIIDAGKSLISAPEIVLTDYGDGQGRAEATLIPSFEELPGKWINSDGIISDRSMKLQGLDYYIDYSYVTVSGVQFKKYKEVLKQLLQPAGTKAYAEIAKLNVIITPQSNVVSEIVQESV
jgi:hypothetical protein